ncbi:MAG: hypothetical protein WAU88_00235 [Candidatus Zixiibacteriota bacterium]
MGRLSAVLSSIYTKIAFGGIIAFAGIVGGMYAGNALVGRSATTEEAVRTDGGPSPTLAIAAGDLFPLEGYSDREGNIGNFEQLIQGRKCLLVFVNFDCPACHNLLKYRKDKMMSRLRSDVKVIICMARREKGLPDEYAGLVSDLPVVYFDGPRWLSVYRMAYWPTIVSVDNSGFIRHIQIGYDDAIDREIVDEFYTSNR